VVQEVAEDLDIHRLLDDRTSAREPMGSNLRFGLDMDYRKEWDGEAWLPPERPSRAPAKKNGASVTKISETFAEPDWRLTLSPDEARDYIQNLTRMLKSGNGESGPREAKPIRTEKLP
jgi:hypothetical protein